MGGLPAASGGLAESVHMPVAFHQTPSRHGGTGVLSMR